MINRIEIDSINKDSESFSFEKKIKILGCDVEVFVSSVYTIDYNFSDEEITKISDSLHNKTFQTSRINKPITSEKFNFDFALELGFLPGVTDNIANTTTEIINDLFGINIGLNKVFTSRLLFLKGKNSELSEEDVKKIAKNLINILIERYHIKSTAKYYENKGMDKITPIVKISIQPKVLEIDLDISDDELQLISKQGIFDPETNERRGPLALELDYFKAIQDYFKKEDRKPTDIEIETIAQTWSEHCKHTIFASEIDDIKEGIFSKYIKGSTKKIRETLGEKDFCISVFKDNSGAIDFDENYMITDKAETHNSPSALDPYGGAITGIVGVNRDTMGFGLGALPIANKYGFCLGRPEDKEIIYRGKNKENPILLPRRIMDGVIQGVNVGGNCSGIPTPTGFVYFDDDYKGKPLIFVGTVGIIPKKLVDGRFGHEKLALPNDNIVMVGGRVGKDGIHGATFSSEALTSGSPATAVQIGDPITQKKCSDAVIKEARDLGLYNSITDNGAGGLSSSVGEMAEQSGGFILELDKVPLKYPGLQPWEIWISESQERMTLSIPDDKLNEFMSLMKERGVESTVIGKFTDSKRAVINYEGKTIFDMDMDFLHNGLPDKKLVTKPYPYNIKEPELKIKNEEHNEILLKLINQHNNCSFEFISRQYDHEVQNNSVIKPLQGVGRVNGSASVIRPLLNSYKGVVMSQVVLPRLSHINCYDMAACAIDTAIRNSVAVGGNIDHMALMDNFCWCSSTEPERLSQLKETAKACYDYSVSYLTPLVSGKDSMFNDFKGFDKENNPLKISVPPTLMISSTGVIEDTRNTCTIDFKKEDDLIYLIGKTKDELGGSELYHLYNKIGANSPKVNSKEARKLYQKMYKFHQKDIFNSCYSIGAGGLGLALAKMAIAGKLGAQINLENLNSTLPVEKLLYSESQSRFVVAIDSKNKEEFENSIYNAVQIGIVKGDKLIIQNNSKEIINLNVNELESSYKERFKDF